MSEATVWCNGEWRAASAPVVSIGDRGLAVGLGLFETLAAVDGVALALRRHLDRLEASAPWCGVPVPERGVLAAVAAEVLERNGLGEGLARVRITATAGAGDLRCLEPGADPVVIVSASRVAQPALSASAVMCPWTRNEQDPLAGHKTLSYASNVRALDWARRAGFDEPVFANTRGELCECATANLFLVVGGTMLTPSLLTGCLPGVTRGLVLELARAEGVPLEEVEVAAGRLTEASEAFVTSALRGVQPLHRLGYRELPVAGPVTARLARALADLLGRRADP